MARFFQESLTVLCTVEDILAEKAQTKDLWPLEIHFLVITEKCPAKGKPFQDLTRCVASKGRFWENSSIFWTCDTVLIQGILCLCLVSWNLFLARGKAFPLPDVHIVVHSFLSLLWLLWVLLSYFAAGFPCIVSSSELASFCLHLLSVGPMVCATSRAQDALLTQSTFAASPKRG